MLCCRFVLFRICQVSFGALLYYFCRFAFMYHSQKAIFLLFFRVFMYHSQKAIFLLFFRVFMRFPYDWVFNFSNKLAYLLASAIQQ